MSATTPAPSIGSAADRAAVRSLQINDVVATYVVDGVVTVRASEFFPGVSRELWRPWRKLFHDDDTMLMSAGGLLIERDSESLLIDAGAGPTDTPLPFGSADCGSMLDVLGSLGKRPADIETVAFTHLHFDHAGWAFTEDEDGLQRRTFPNAQYVLSGPEVTRNHPDAIAAQRFVVPMAAAATPIRDGEEIFPGVRAMAAAGHTPGHVCYIIEMGEDVRLIALGDAFHSPAQVTHPDWLCIADGPPQQVRHSRRQLLAELMKPNTLGFSFHFGDQPFGRVAVDGSGVLTWVPEPAIAIAPPPRT